jgi:biopolymer transport protein ExbD
MAGASMRRRGMITEINVTPLVDIMLVLLIVFMLTAHLIARRTIDVELPRAATGATPTPTTIAVTLKADGTIFLNDAPTTAADLETAVRSAVGKDAHTQVVIAGDKNVPYGRIVWVLDLVRSLHVTSFSMQVDPTMVVPPP